MYKTNKDAILASIDNVNEVAMEADMSVIHAMADSYEKAAFIMENYTGDEANMFSIFQEDAEVKKKSWLAEDPDEGIFMKIIKFIPRMLAKIWQFIKSVWSGKAIPAAEKATKTLSNIPDKIKNFIDKFGDKDESWFEQHKTELGLGGAALTAAVTLVALLNKNKLKNLVEKFIANISKALHNVQVAIKGRKILFDITVGCKVKTNVGFKKISALVKALPEYFKKLKEIKKYNKNLDKFMKSIDEVKLNVPGETFEIVDTEDKAVEVDLGEICGILTDTGKDILDLTINTDTSDLINYNPFSEVQSLLDELKDDSTGKKKDLVAKLKQFQSSVNSTGSFIQGLTVDSKSGVLKQLTDIAEQVEILKKSYEEGGASTEDLASHAEEDAQQHGYVTNEDIKAGKNDDGGGSYDSKFTYHDALTPDQVISLMDSYGIKQTIDVDENGNLIDDKGKVLKTINFGKNHKYTKVVQNEKGQYILEHADVVGDTPSNSWYAM